MKNLLAVIFILLTFISCMEGTMQHADADFNPRVKSPTYKKENPVLLFDEGHRNFHTSSGRYQPFVQMAESDGYELKVLHTKTTQSALTGADVYIIANAEGTGDMGDSPAFTPEECTAIERWVYDGGSLFLIADHFPYGSAAQSLADKFGLHFQKGLVEDSMQYDKNSSDQSQLVFSKENKLLPEHPITKNVDKVITFTGQSIRCADSCFAFLVLSPTAYDLSARTVVTHDGNDTRVEVNYENPVSAYGRAQGVALQHGKGKVVALGEAAMMTAQRMEDFKFGMNYNPDNKQLALNILHWLTD